LVVLGKETIVGAEVDRVTASFDILNVAFGLALPQLLTGETVPFDDEVSMIAGVDVVAIGRHMHPPKPCLVGSFARTQTHEWEVRAGWLARVDVKSRNPPAGIVIRDLATSSNMPAA
jgi:hypothetical protein